MSLRFYINMAKGYKEMGNINLQIANKHIQVETEEGVNVYEMEENEGDFIDGHSRSYL